MATVNTGPVDVEFEKIYRATRARLLTFIRRRVESSTAAEDILQDVFVKLLSKGHAVRQRESLPSWIYQVARRAIVDHWRREHRPELLPDNLPAPEPEHPAFQEVANCLLPLMQTLPDIYRDALQLSDLRDLSLNELARTQGLSLANAKSRVQRGRKKLKQLLLDCCRVEVNAKGSITGYVSRGDCC